MQPLDRKYTSRKALIYTRVSSPEQKARSEGSISHQRAQGQHALRLGWRPEDIEILDGDLGKSGTAVVRRHEYLDVRRRIQAGEVGAIFASEMSRFGRNAMELLALHQDCRDNDTRIVLNGEVNDPNNPTQNFMAQVHALIAEYENLRRAEMMQRGRIAKARDGKAVSKPPAGYVVGRRGEWILDPDQRVRDPISAIFRIFAEVRSLKKTVDKLNALGIEYCTRRGAMVSSRKPTVCIITRTLHNPSYMGAYVFPQRKVDHRAGLTAAGFVRVRKAEADETIVIPDHHPGYVSPEEWEENIRTLAGNAPSRERRSAGEGPGLLQGIIRCGDHNAAMSTRHIRTRRDGSVSYAYQCLGDFLAGGEQCGYLTGLHLDREITAALLLRLSPPEMETVQRAWEAARYNATSEERRRTAALRHAQARVDDAKARLLDTVPHRPHVQEAYEEEFEVAMQRLKEIQRLANNQPSMIDDFTEEAWRDLLELAYDIAAIWYADTTENRDRKDLARMMIDKVIIEEKVKSGRMTERIIARIVWVDGDESTIEVKLAPIAHKIIAELAAAQVDLAEIADRLCADGYVTSQGNPWTRSTVAKYVSDLRKRGE